MSHQYHEYGLPQVSNPYAASDSGSDGAEAGKRKPRSAGIDVDLPEESGEQGGTHGNGRGETSEHSRHLGAGSSEQDDGGVNDCPPGQSATHGQLRFHRYANVFPLMPKESPEYKALVADVRRRGVLDHPWIDEEGEILDGRNRCRAAEEVGILDQVMRGARVYRGDDALGLVLSLNMRRRHLDEAQRAMLGARLETCAHGGDRKSDQDANLQIDRARAAELANVSPRSVAHARKVLDCGVPELIEAVETGKVSVSGAAAIAELSADEQRKLLKDEPKAIKRAAAKARKQKRNASTEDRKDGSKAETPEEIPPEDVPKPRALNVRPVPELGEDDQCPGTNQLPAESGDDPGAEQKDDEPAGAFDETHATEPISVTSREEDLDRRYADLCRFMIAKIDPADLEQLKALISGTDNGPLIDAFEAAMNDSSVYRLTLPPEEASRIRSGSSSEANWGSI